MPCCTPCILAGLVCLLVVAYVANRAVLIAREDSAAVPYVVLSATAGAGMLIANWTNPYLIAPGHGWTIALILGVVVAFGNKLTALDSGEVTPEKRATQLPRHGLGAR